MVPEGDRGKRETSTWVASFWSHSVPRGIWARPGGPENQAETIGAGSELGMGSAEVLEQTEGTALEEAGTTGTSRQAGLQNVLLQQLPAGGGGVR